MKIFYDYQIFELQKYGGISRYFSEIMSKGKNNLYFDYVLPIIYSSNHYLQNIPEISLQLKGGSNFYEDFCYGYEFKGKWLLYNLKNRYFNSKLNTNLKSSINKLSLGDFDVFHPTDLSLYFLDYIGNRPFVVTIHDMIDEIYPEYSFHVHSKYNSLIKKKLIEKSHRVIAVSNNTKKDIISFYNINPDKIDVIYHANSLVNTKHEKKENYPYFLYVGKRTHYKNFYFLLQAVADILLKEDIKIICAGGTSFNNKEILFFKSLGIDKHIIFRNAYDSDLANLYKNALAMLYPSLYEGFGIPILEAFANDCPCLLSKTGALEETAQDAALYFSPKNISEIKYLIEYFLLNPHERISLIKKGKERIKLFSWDKTTKETSDVYYKIVK